MLAGSPGRCTKCFLLIAVIAVDAASAAAVDESDVVVEEECAADAAANHNQRIAAGSQTHRLACLFVCLLVCSFVAFTKPELDIS